MSSCFSGQSTLLSRCFLMKSLHWHCGLLVDLQCMKTRNSSDCFFSCASHCIDFQLPSYCPADPFFCPKFPQILSCLIWLQLLPPYIIFCKPWFSDIHGALNLCRNPGCNTHCWDMEPWIDFHAESLHLMVTLWFSSLYRVLIQRENFSQWSFLAAPLG